MDLTSLHRIVRMKCILGGVLVAVCGALGTLEHVLGSLVGVVLGAVNFMLVARIVEKMALAAQGKVEARAGSMFLAPKMAILMGLVFAALYFLPISAPMLAVGFSVFMLSIVVEAVRYVLLRSSTAAE
jgi:hypothetical protein